MKSLNLCAAIVLSLSMSLFWYGSVRAQDVQAHTAELNGVLQAFRRAITDKDEAGFLALFLDGQTTWQSVESDAKRAAMRAAGGPELAKVTLDPNRSARTFIRRIVESEGRHDEAMSDIVISTDGDIASVFFDFTYLFNDRPINAGHEAWHLVRTDAGWRIVSVIWSSHPADAAEALATGP